MALSLLLSLAGLALLIIGGDALVRGACGLALLARLTPALVALTIVSAGTSMPELVVSVQASLAGNSGLAMGNVIGSNIFNIGAILGLAALIRPLRITASSMRIEWPVMMGSSIALAIMIQDGVVSRAEGALLGAALIGFITLAARASSRAPADTSASEPTTASFGATGARALAYNLAAIIAGVALLAAGSSLLVMGCVEIARGLGVTDTVIGLTIVAAGTSAPELITSLVASRRGQDDIAVGNVIGSNIFNILCILSATALITPLPVPAEILTRDVWWMLAISAALLPIGLTGMRVRRVEGAALLFAFLAYTAAVLSST